MSKKLSKKTDPDKPKTQRVLFVGAHPDDIELGCWGTMLRHLEKGDDVYAIVFSRGERGLHGMPEDRIAVSEKAYTACGLPKKNIFLLDIPDTKFMEHREKIFKSMECVCNDFNITKVFTHTDKEYHQDHITVHDESLRAARNVQNILTYESNAHTFPTFSPNYFTDITDYLDDKVAVINTHTSQMNKKYCEADNIKALAKFRGYQSRTSNYSEAFEVVRMVEC